MWNGIVLHHSKGADNLTRLSFDEIRKFHMDQPPVGRGWVDVGYQHVIERVDGSLIAIIGRPLDKMGSHAPPRNSDTLGVCFVADFDLAPPDQDMLDFAAHYVVCPAINLFQMKFPECLLAHRDVTPARTCPGKFFSMDALRKAVAKRLGYSS